MREGEPEGEHHGILNVTEFLIGWVIRNFRESLQLSKT